MSKCHDCKYIKSTVEKDEDDFLYTAYICLKYKQAVSKFPIFDRSFHMDLTVGRLTEHNCHYYKFNGIPF